MKRKTAKILSLISIIVVVLISLLLVPTGNSDAITLTFIIYIPIAIALSYFMRCPHCGAWPRKGSLFHRYCPRCGKDLEE